MLDIGPHNSDTCRALLPEALAFLCLTLCLLVATCMSALACRLASTADAAVDAHATRPGDVGSERINGLLAAPRGWSDGPAHGGWTMASNFGDGGYPVSTKDGTGWHRPPLSLDWTQRPCPGGVVWSANRFVATIEEHST